MQIVSIFVKDDSQSEGLHAFSFDDEIEEFSRIFKLWRDTKYIQDYLNQNIENLESGYYKYSSIDEVIDDIRNQAISLQKLILQYAENGFNTKGDNLQMLFKPLDNRESSIPLHQETKAKPDKKEYKKPIIRLYAIRIDANTFILTGGLIKLTERMDQCPYGIIELDKIKQAKSFLKQQGIKFEEDLDNYYDL
jgi:hypothetical protein